VIERPSIGLTLAKRFEDGRTVTHGAGDRRTHRRYEIVGSLAGSLKVWDHFSVRNLGPHGALIETSQPPELDARIRVRVTLRGQARDVDARVRRVVRDVLVESGPQYGVGLEFGGRWSRLDDLLGEQVLHEVARAEGERRRGPRIECNGDATVGIPRWAIVAFSDISLGGALFTADIRLEAGAKALLHSRLGPHGFAAEIEVRRVEPQGSDQGRYRTGTSFVSMDEASRRSLESFLGTALS